MGRWVPPVLPTKVVHLLEVSVSQLLISYILMIQTPPLSPGMTLAHGKYKLGAQRVPDGEFKRGGPIRVKIGEPNGMLNGVKRGINSVLDLNLDPKEQAQSEPNADKARGKKRNKTKVYRGANTKKLGLSDDDSPRLVVPRDGKGAVLVDFAAKDGIEREVSIFFKCCCLYLKDSCPPSVVIPIFSRMGYSICSGVDAQESAWGLFVGWSKLFSDEWLAISRFFLISCKVLDQVNFESIYTFVYGLSYLEDRKQKSSRGVQWEDFQKSLKDAQLAITPRADQQQMIAKEKQLQLSL
uniref:Uncharacterized protein n=1 Tax=Chenopodium quinoa TaxID=63459 RepID=A0A803MEQ1_CHEQI